MNYPFDESDPAFLAWIDRKTVTAARAGLSLPRYPDMAREWARKLHKRPAEPQQTQRNARPRLHLVWSRD